MNDLANSVKTRDLSIAGTKFLEFIQIFLVSADRPTPLQSFEDMLEALGVYKLKSKFNRLLGIYREVALVSNESALYGPFKKLLNHAFDVLKLPLDYCSTFDGSLSNDHKEYYNPGRK